jgi:steroid delta-isomerase
MALRDALRSMVKFDDGDRRATIERLVRSYLTALNANDVEGRSKLFAPDASVEDPVGSQPIVGHEALKKFWTGAGGLTAKAQLEKLAIVSESEAAYSFLVRLSVGDDHATINPMVAIKVNDAGLISSMRVYFDKSSIT